MQLSSSLAVVTSEIRFKSASHLPGVVLVSGLRASTRVGDVPPKPKKASARSSSFRSRALRQRFGTILVGEAATGVAATGASAGPAIQNLIARADRMLGAVIGRAVSMSCADAAGAGARSRSGSGAEPADHGLSGPFSARMMTSCMPEF
jgi:hypothetical protein